MPSLSIMGDTPAAPTGNDEGSTKVRSDTPAGSSASEDPSNQPSGDHIDAMMGRLGKALDQREARIRPVAKAAEEAPKGEPPDADLDKATLDDLKVLSAEEEKQSKNPNRTKRRLEKLWEKARAAEALAHRNHKAHEFLEGLGKAGLDDASLKEAVRVFLNRKAGSAEYAGWLKEEAKRAGVSLGEEKPAELPQNLQEAVDLGLLTVDQARKLAQPDSDPAGAQAARKPDPPPEDPNSDEPAPESIQFLQLLEEHGVAPAQHAEQLRKLTPRVMELAKKQGWVTALGELDRRKFTAAREALLFTQAFYESIGKSSSRPTREDEPPAPSHPSRRAPAPAAGPGDPNSDDIVERYRAKWPDRPPGSRTR